MLKPSTSVREVLLKHERSATNIKTLALGLAIETRAPGWRTKTHERVGSNITHERDGLIDTQPN